MRSAAYFSRLLGLRAGPRRSDVVRDDQVTPSAHGRPPSAGEHVDDLPGPVKGPVDECQGDLHVRPAWLRIHKQRAHYLLVSSIQTERTAQV